MDKKDLKVLLFSDAPMALNEGGFCQTLYNLFCFIEPENFLGVTAALKLDMFRIGPRYMPRHIRYSHDWITIPFNNRFTKYFRPIVSWLNYTICKLKSYEKLKRSIDSFNPDIIISCSNMPIGILMYSKILSGCKYSGRVVPYFMDDWMLKRDAKWLGGSVNTSVGDMLTNNKNWMMIGKELSEILEERYGAKPDKLLCVRNPVDMIGLPSNVTYKRNDIFTIAYAGALWPMHYDSFYAVAKAVNILSGSTKLQLKIFTAQGFWDSKKAELEPLGVIYGGYLAYADVHQQLNNADALLLTSSFQDEYYTHSKASLQTKITDYCLSKRLILSCGPSYSANNNFIKANNCGVCFETNNETEIAAKLSEVINKIEQYQNRVQNAWDVLKDFSKPVVHQHIKSFLNEINSNLETKQVV